MTSNEQKKMFEKKIKLKRKFWTIKCMPLVPVFSWYEMKIHTDISSEDHKEKEMESITCYKMAMTLKQQQHNQVGL